MRIAALGLLAAACFSVPAFAAEPNGPAGLITPAEGLRVTIQGLASAKSNSPQRDALVQYYGAPDRNLLWVDDNGLTERAKLVMAEIGKADDYGLRASDYPLPDAASFNPSDPGGGRDWLAQSEMKVSYAVLDYAKDARGGRIEPVRVSKNLDPNLALPNPSEVLEVIAIRSDPAAYLRSFQPAQPQFEALRQKLIELRGGKAQTRTSSTRPCSTRCGSSNPATARAPTAPWARARGVCSIMANSRGPWAARRGSGRFS